MGKIAVAKVPGKVMLAGEYAVLEGGRALAATVSDCLTIEAELQEGFDLISDLWATPYRSDILPDDSSSPFVQAVAATCLVNDFPGCRMRVESDLNVDWGMGSSSALLLGVLLAGRGLGDLSFDQFQLSALWPVARQAFELQLARQGVASGYDVYTQYFGGLNIFSTSQWRGDCPETVSLPLEFIRNNFHIVVGGEGAPTTSTMQSTGQWLRASGRFADLLTISDALIDQILDGSHDLVDLVARHRRLLHDSPQFPRQIAKILSEISGCDKKWTFKTTGAGGEDALLLIGSKSEVAEALVALEALGWQLYAGQWDDRGCQLEVRTES